MKYALRELRAFIDQQQGLSDKLGSKLVVAGLMSPEENASARPSLQVQISDERSKKTLGLPVVPTAESNVKIVN